MALAQAPADTEASPFSIRCSVTRDMPATSAAAVLLTRSALRRAKLCAQGLELGSRLCEQKGYFGVHVL
jgi:hypothetical protein